MDEDHFQHERCVVAAWAVGCGVESVDVCRVFRVWILGDGGGRWRKDGGW